MKRKIDSEIKKYLNSNFSKIKSLKELYLVTNEYLLIDNLEIDSYGVIKLIDYLCTKFKTDKIIVN